MQFEALSAKVIGMSIDVHRELGPGLLESTYETCLAHELSRAGIRFRKQHPMPVRYKGVSLDCGYRVDLLVEESLIVELKAVDELQGVHEAQLLTYLKLSGIKTGLLINFNVPVLKEGIRRFVI
jgi:GxxExxY protein